MLKRAITGFFFVIIMITAIWWSFWSLLALFAFIVVAGLKEFHALRLTSNPGLKFWPLLIGGLIVFSLCIIESPYFSFPDGNSTLLHSYFLTKISLGTVLLLLMLVDLFDRNQKNFPTLSNGLFAALYIGLPFGLLFHLIPFNEEAYSGKLILAFFILLWTNDTFAYLSGKFLGRHKLWERISPNKTWEGFFGGWLFTCIAFYLILHFNEIRVDVFILIGVPSVVSIFGTLGDLSESLLKRQAGVKDSGTLMPGHGGVLDRFDGVLLSMPAMAVLVSVYSLLQ